MDARELAEEILREMNSDQVAEILHRESAKHLGPAIGEQLSMLYDGISFEDVIREIESLLGV